MLFIDDFVTFRNTGIESVSGYINGLLTNYDKIVNVVKLHRAVACPRTCSRFSLLSVAVGPVLPKPKARVSHILKNYYLLR
jgi:hypothetical protein